MQVGHAGSQIRAPVRPHGPPPKPRRSPEASDVQCQVFSTAESTGVSAVEAPATVPIPRARPTITKRASVLKSDDTSVSKNSGVPDGDIPMPKTKPEVQRPSKDVATHSNEKRNDVRPGPTMIRPGVVMRPKPESNHHCSPPSADSQQAMVWPVLKPTVDSQSNEIPPPGSARPLSNESVKVQSQKSLENKSPTDIPACSVATKPITSDTNGSQSSKPVMSTEMKTEDKSGGIKSTPESNKPVIVAAAAKPTAVKRPTIIRPGSVCVSGTNYTAADLPTTDTAGKSDRRMDEVKNEVQVRRLVLASTTGVKQDSRVTPAPEVNGGVDSVESRAAPQVWT